jgi:hypothetical protein
MTFHLRDVRVQLMLLSGVLLVVALAAAGLLLSPAGRGLEAREHTYNELRRERIDKAQEALPLQGMDQKISTARQQQKEFSEQRVADHYSTVSEQISSLGKEAGVIVSNVHYDRLEQGKTREAPAGYEKVGITITVQGTYEQELRFINAVERQKMMLIIDAVGFSGSEGKQLSVSVHLSTYLRSAA